MVVLNVVIVEEPTQHRQLDKVRVMVDDSHDEAHDGSEEDRGNADALEKKVWVQHAYTRQRILKMPRVIGRFRADVGRVFVVLFVVCVQPFGVEQAVKVVEVDVVKEDDDAELQEPVHEAIVFFF